MGTKQLASFLGMCNRYDTFILIFCRFERHAKLNLTPEKILNRYAAIILSIFITLTPAANAETVRQLRDQCLVARNIMNEGLNRAITADEALDIGECLGQMKAEIRWRNLSCILWQVTGSEQIKAVGRQMLDMDAAQTMQAFLNWTDDNPELWSKNLWDVEVQQSVFQKYTCKRM